MINITHDPYNNPGHNLLKNWVKQYRIGGIGHIVGQLDYLKHMAKEKEQELKQFIEIEEA